MSTEKYPLLASSEDRWCHIFEPTGACPHFPCIHTPSHDPNWLEDCEGRLRDPDYLDMLWKCYRSQDFKATMSLEEWEMYKVNFERCGRIKWKFEKIWADSLECHERLLRRHREIARKQIEDSMGKSKEVGGNVDVEMSLQVNELSL
jgi:hypothetical protein